ncbi:MAG: nucleotidyltransferase domain-containing protein [Candidatus Melainabacteria bacterium]|nr:nucleotidyltransferase domain-containing protein [Candidatus Melainabacteria bacterium]
MLDKDKIIRLLREIKPKLEKDYGFETIFLFGSYVRNEAGVNSDVDIAVKVKNNLFKTWDNFLNAKDEMQSLLGSEVDLIYFDSMNPIIKEEIGKENIKIE